MRPNSTLISQLVIASLSIILISSCGIPETIETRSSEIERRNEVSRQARLMFSEGNFAGGIIYLGEVVKKKEWGEELAPLLISLVRRFSDRLLIFTIEQLDETNHDKEVEAIYRFYLQLHQAEARGYDLFFSWLITRERFEEALVVARLWQENTAPGDTNGRSLWFYWQTTIALFFNQLFEELEQRATQLHKEGLLWRDFFKDLMELSDEENFHENLSRLLTDYQTHLINQRRQLIDQYNDPFFMVSQGEYFMPYPKDHILEQWLMFRDWEEDHNQYFDHWKSLWKRDNRPLP